MAVIRKTRTGKYELDFYANGKRQRVTFQSRREAEDAKRELIFGASGSGKDPIKPMTIREAFKFYFDTESKSKSSGKNEGAYFDRLFKFFRAEGLTMVHEITTLQIDAFKANRAKSVKGVTVNREFNTYRHFFNKCVDWEAIVKSPCEKVENLPAMKNPRRVWTDEEFALVISKIPAWAADFLTGLYWLGAGPAELARLTWSEIDFDKKVVLLKRYKGSGDELRRYMPMPEEFEKFLIGKREVARRGFSLKLTDRVFVNSKRNPVDPRALSTLVKRVVDDNGLPPGTVPYGVRHKFGTELLEANVGEEKVRRLMGHKSVRTLIENYAHVRNESLKAAMEVRASQADNVKKLTLKNIKSNGR